MPLRKYDGLGRIVELRDDTSGGNLRTSFVYDTLAAGQPTSSTRHVGSDAYTTAVTGYTDLYKPTGSTVTIPAVEAALAGTYTTSATYHPDGSIATASLPGAGGLPAETISHGYNAAGLPTTMASGSGSYVASTSHHWDGAVNERILGNTANRRVRVTNTLDAATRRLSAVQVDTENSTIPNVWTDRSISEYGYDQAGNIVAIAGKSDGVQDQAECFRYDHLRRLTDAWTEATPSCATPQRAGADPYRLSWTYDVMGNRATQTSHSATGTTTATSTYPAAGGPQPHALDSVVHTGEESRTDTYDYDQAGNTTLRTVDGVTQNLTWDAEGHLATTSQSGQNTSYVYDAGGNRLLRKDATGTTLYLGETELRLTTSSGQVDGTRYYSHSGDTVAVRTVTGLTRIITDHHGTGTLAINTDTSPVTVTRRRSMPFGESRGTRPSGWPGEKGFVGGTQDPTGLVHLGAREYDPTTGRFISVDPVQDFSDPQQWDGYAYANNSPVNLSDPSGLYAPLAALLGIAIRIVIRHLLKSAGKVKVLSRKGPARQRSERDQIRAEKLVGRDRAKNPRRPSEEQQLRDEKLTGRQRIKVTLDEPKPPEPDGAGARQPPKGSGNNPNYRPRYGNNSEVAVDANALIGALDFDLMAALDSALAGRAPVVSQTAANEYLRKGSREKLDQFLEARGGRVVADAHFLSATALMNHAASTGRNLKSPDATVAATAIRDGLPLITRDRRLYNFMSVSGYNVERF